MNIRNRDIDEPAFDEREWQAQEAAFRAERVGAAVSADDPLAARHRSVSRALRQPHVDAPPADFAASLARQVAARQIGEAKFEAILLRLLTALLGLAGGVTCMIYGRQWLQAMTRGASGDAVQWGMVIAACVGTYWALEQWRARRVMH